MRLLLPEPTPSPRLCTSVRARPHSDMFTLTSLPGGGPKNPPRTKFVLKHRAKKTPRTVRLEIVTAIAANTQPNLAAARP